MRSSITKKKGHSSKEKLTAVHKQQRKRSNELVLTLCGACEETIPAGQSGSYHMLQNHNQKKMAQIVHRKRQPVETVWL